MVAAASYLSLFSCRIVPSSAFAFLALPAALVVLTHKLFDAAVERTTKALEKKINLKKNHLVSQISQKKYNLLLYTIGVIGTIRGIEFFNQKMSFFLRQLQMFVPVLKQERNVILLGGLRGTGKTSLFHLLRNGNSPQEALRPSTFSEDSFILHSEPAQVNPVHVLDVPEHFRYGNLIDKYLPQAAGLVFVFDTSHSSDMSNCRAAADYLWHILTNSSVKWKKIPILVLCNKIDRETGHTKDSVRVLLQSQIDAIAREKNYTLGAAGRTFSFDHCQNRVIFGEAYGMSGNASDLTQFIREHVRA